MRYCAPDRANFSCVKDEDRDEEKFPAAVRVSERMREDSLRAEEPDEAADLEDEAVDFARVIRGRFSCGCIEVFEKLFVGGNVCISFFKCFNNIGIDRSKC